MLPPSTLLVSGSHPIPAAPRFDAQHAPLPRYELFRCQPDPYQPSPLGPGGRGAPVSCVRGGPFQGEFRIFLPWVAGEAARAALIRDGEPGRAIPRQEQEPGCRESKSCAAEVLWACERIRQEDSWCRFCLCIFVCFGGYTFTTTYITLPFCSQDNYSLY